MDERADDDDWTQYTPFTPLPDEAEWKVRVFAMYVHANVVVPQLLRPIISLTDTDEAGVADTLNFHVVREFEIPVPMEDTRPLSKWCRTTDDEDRVVWRCVSSAYLGQWGLRGLRGSPSVQFLFRPPMNDFVMK